MYPDLEEDDALSLVESAGASSGARLPKIEIQKFLLVTNLVSKSIHREGLFSVEGKNTYVS